ncbi:MAG: helix-turn-helix domain-containing protein [Candidatus Asgardarchaeia archaeon]
MILHYCFGLPTLTTSIFFRLLEKGPADIKELAEEFNRDESTIYRYVQPLLDDNLVEKIVIRREVGRPKFIYQAVDKKKLGEKIIDIIEECHKKIIRFVSEVLLNGS